MEGPHKCSVAPICQGSDDKTCRVTQIFVAVVDSCICDADKHSRLFPIVSQLGQPVEVILCGNTCIKLMNNEAALIPVEMQY